MRGEIPTRLAKLLVIIIVSSALFACGSDNPAETASNNVIESTFGKITHNANLDCMQSGCHVDPASGARPQFTLGGTVYTGLTSNTIHPNARVELYLDGQLFHSIPVGASGTFYTNVSIPWGPTLTAKVKNTVSNASSVAMSALPVKADAGCNGCHDASQRLYGP